MLANTKKGPRRGCLCVGNAPMSLAEWAREMDLRPAEARSVWKELFRVGSFEWREIDGERFCHVYAFEQNQDRINKKKIEPKAAPQAAERGSLPVLPVDNSAILVDKSVDNSVSAAVRDHDFELSRDEKFQSTVRSVVDSITVVNESVGFLPIQNVNVPLTLKDPDLTVAFGPSPPCPPSAPAVGANGTKPNGTLWQTTPRGPNRIDTQACRGPLVRDSGSASAPPHPRGETVTEPGTEPGVDACRLGQGGDGPKATVTVVTGEMVSRLVEDLVAVLRDEHSRACWNKRVSDFAGVPGGFVRFVGEWEDMKRRMLRGEGPGRPASKFNKQTSQLLAELRRGVQGGSGR